MMMHTLVVEDDPDFARTLRRVLEGRGHEVAHAASIAEARRLVAERAHDLVLLDQQLPDGLGLSLIEELAGARHRPVVIMITGVDLLSTTVEAIQRGAYDYFVKPPDLDDLLAVIDRAQRERALR